VANERRGVGGIRTMAALHDQRRNRTAGGALLELSALSNEKLLLEREIARASRRGIEIARRLKEIAAKEDRLMKIVQGSAPVPGLVCETGLAPPAEPMIPAEVPPPSRFKVSEFNY
jgi:hypothetical protein